MNKTAACILATAALAAPAFASSSDTALALGNVLASEEVCGLTYDQDAIGKYIEQNVAEDDMQFASTLQLMTEGTKLQLQDMGKSQLTAHCAQIKRVAKKYGFTAGQ